MDLQKLLGSQGRNRWLDVGCGGRFCDGFDYLDIFPRELIADEYRDRYWRIDILHPTEKQFRALGQYDLVRLQHVLEHFSFEDGAQALRSCARLLKPTGIIVITVPDLLVHVQRYLTGRYANWERWRKWAEERVPADAPPSAFFSVFAHSMTFEPHKWCYDAAGVKYQLARVGKYQNIRELPSDDPLASDPFTHNRPDEDVCVIAEGA